jgi:MoxR-like ATPase
MQEREVSIGESTFRLPEPFMVLATQNPIEQEGTYPLPEAQLDRFLMKLTVTYPSFDDEVSILQLPVMQPQGPGTTNSDQRTPVVTLDELRALRKEVPNVFVDPRIDRYIVTIVHATRDAKNFGLRGMVEWGASPRGSIALKNSARALAFLRGENSVTPEIVQELVPDVLRHRILTSFEAEAKGINADEVLRVLIKSVQVP